MGNEQVEYELVSPLVTWKLFVKNGRVVSGPARMRGNSLEEVKMMALKKGLKLQLVQPEPEEG